jgi:flavorubredoxin
MAQDEIRVDEIAPNVYRLSNYIARFNLQFNSFLIKDDEPLLYHTGMRGMFPLVRQAVARLIEASKIRWIGASHFEVDEWGGLNDWLQEAPQATPVCGEIGGLVNLNDFSPRPPRLVTQDEILSTGAYRFRLYPTPHLPHGWDAAMLYEETHQTLFCSDLFHQNGNVMPLTEADIVEEARQSLLEFQSTGPLMDYMPYTANTKRLLHQLADLQPKTLGVMHGSSFAGDCARALRDLAVVMREVYGEPE